MSVFEGVTKSVSIFLLSLFYLSIKRRKKNLEIRNYYFNDILVELEDTIRSLHVLYNV